MLDIPLEEVFFFVIQTYNTTLLYLILSKPTFQPAYLRANDPAQPTHWRRQRIAGQLFFSAAIIWGALRVREWREGAYTGLILVWAGPVLLGLWYAISLHSASTF